MRKLNWQLYLGISLIALSAILYFFHYWLFRDAHHIFIYLLGDIAFVPIEVLLVTLIIHKLIDVKEKNKIHNKLNMIIGVFFSEIGSRMLEIIYALDKNRDMITKYMVVEKNWAEKEFKGALKKTEKYNFKVQSDMENLETIEKLLHSKRDFLIKLLENPALLEHDRFTDLLRAVFHLEDELAKRIDLNELNEKTKSHIEMDIGRVYKLLVFEWINYLKYLRKQHPYFFMFAVATNPIKKTGVQN